MSWRDLFSFHSLSQQPSLFISFCLLNSFQLEIGFVLNDRSTHKRIYCFYYRWFDSIGFGVVGRSKSSRRSVKVSSTQLVRNRTYIFARSLLCVHVPLSIMFKSISSCWQTRWQCLLLFASVCVCLLCGLTVLCAEFVQREREYWPTAILPYDLLLTCYSVFFLRPLSLPISVASGSFPFGWLADIRWHCLWKR